MKLRITPLNIVVAGAAVMCAYYYLTPVKGPAYNYANSLIAYLLIFVVLVAFITDLVFRFFFKEIRKIWLVELVFILLTVVVFLILQK
jgi:hypothetical protein